MCAQELWEVEVRFLLEKLWRLPQTSSMLIELLARTKVIPTVFVWSIYTDVVSPEFLETLKATMPTQ